MLKSVLAGRVALALAETLLIVAGALPWSHALFASLAALPAIAASVSSTTAPGRAAAAIPSAGCCKPACATPARSCTTCRCWFTSTAAAGADFASATSASAGDAGA